MREILFRGKRTDNGEWVEGDLLQVPTTNHYAIMPQTPSSTAYYVIPETIGQYTGLTDKNGTNICEGDIVAGALHWLEQKKNGVVAFRNGSFGLIWYRGEVEQFNPFTSMCNIVYEVIGNIHDNPELMKEGASDA